ncbi:enoyl-CoA hydratase-related protein [Spongiibacter taiwanensis]|uniref:enoyl-CoA hydratase-related protein n=1 Tax=Spongiibacter taiwanensis TaxID=1748242 RepID=UPI0020362F86|nr:enoyl-CoA hydratase-related protein [Spongiibacter taiwanensis]USA42869.1 enoyl-CoA hydratase-related protein [Spongiibacter taiwanensis]
MNFTDIAIDIEDGVGILKLNAPDTLNALTANMVAEISEAVGYLEKNCRAMVITGEGRFFCSGASLDPDNPLAPHQPDRSIRDIGQVLEHTLNPLMLTLRDFDIPWISAVKGGAAGFGASLALAADLVIAAEKSYFAQVFALIGLIPDGGSTHLLVRNIGRVRAMELMLLGDRLPAEQALQYGLINRVTPEHETLSTAVTLAKRLAAGPTIALGLIRKAAWEAVDESFADSLARERKQQLIAGRTLDFEEGVSAFVEKRKAQFKGE